MRRFEFRQLLVADFIAAFGGGVAYAVLFDFLLETIGVPRPIATVQLAANFAYGCVGLSIFVSKTSNRRWFFALTAMNFAYSLACALTAAYLTTQDHPIAALLLAGEGAIVLGLAKLELRALQS